MEEEADAAPAQRQADASPEATAWPWPWLHWLLVLAAFVAAAPLVTHVGPYSAGSTITNGVVESVRRWSPWAMVCGGLAIALVVAMLGLALRGDRAARNPRSLLIGLVIVLAGVAQIVLHSGARLPF